MLSNRNKLRTNGMACHIARARNHEVGNHSYKYKNTNTNNILLYITMFICIIILH